MSAYRGTPIGRRDDWIPVSVNSAERLRSPVPRQVVWSFLVAAMFSAMPFFNVPIVGVSASAIPLVIALAELNFRSREAWLEPSRPWRNLLVAFALGGAVSLGAQGVLRSEFSLELGDFSFLLHVLVWLLAFSLTVYLVQRGHLGKAIVTALAVGVCGVAIARAAEVVLFSNIGADKTIFSSRNGYAFYFSAFFPMTIAAAMEARGGRRILFYSGAALVAGAIVINASRGGWIGGVVGATLFLLISSSRRQVARLLLSVVVIGAALLWLQDYMSEDVREVLTLRARTFENLDMDATTATRKVLDQKAWKVFLGSPVVGVGFNRFREVSVPLDLPYVIAYYGEQYLNDFPSHNSYMSLLAETGLLGAGPVALLILSLIVGGFFATRRAVKMGQVWAAGGYAGFIAMSIHMWAINSMITTSVWIVYGLVGGVIVTVRHQCPEAARETVGVGQRRTPGGVPGWMVNPGRTPTSAVRRGR